MKTIENAKQLKGFVIDVCNWLKSKRHIDDFSFADSLNSLCRIKIEFSVKVRKYHFYITFWHVDIRSTKKFVSAKFSSLNQSEIIFAKADKEVFRQNFIEHVLQKRGGLIKEIKFEEVLKIIQSNGFVQEYRKSTDNEDKAGVDWFVYKDQQEIGIDVKASIYGVKRSEKDQASKSEVILQVYDGNDDKNTAHELVQKINQFLTKSQTT